MVKFISKINHPESASTLIGICPNTLPPNKICSNGVPRNAGTAIKELSPPLINTAIRARFPFHFSCTIVSKRIERRVVIMMLMIKLTSFIAG
jgi:hypothetical protein